MRATATKTMLATAVLVAGSAPALGASEQERIERLEKKVEALTEAVERGAGSGGAGDTTISGYGELHYNNTEADAGGDETEQVDFHRFILEFGHRFTDDIRFFSELEFEHAVLSDSGTSEGELKLEQGYIEFDLNDRTRLQTGLFLMPVGILNETHEPPTFYGVERNQVEDAVIPSVWAETGALLKGNLGASGLSYDVGIHTGLDADTGIIEDGVGLAEKQAAEDFAATGRIKYTGISGLELAASTSLQGDISQGDGPADDAVFLTGHAIYNIGDFKLTGLYADWSVDGNVANAAEDQSGGYLEASYRPIEQFGVFARFSNIDIFDGTDLDRDQTTLGVNYWPTPDVVFKADIQQQDANNGNDASASDGFNLGIGYQF